MYYVDPAVQPQYPNFFARSSVTAHLQLVETYTPLHCCFFIDPTTTFGLVPQLLL